MAVVAVDVKCDFCAKQFEFVQPPVTATPFTGWCLNLLVHCTHDSSLVGLQVHTQDHLASRQSSMQPTTIIKLADRPLVLSASHPPCPLMFHQVNAAFTANVWDIKVDVGDKVSKDQPLLVLEAMKMESPILSPRDGVVKAITAAQGSLTHAGQLLLVIEAVA